MATILYFSVLDLGPVAWRLFETLSAV